MRVGVDDNSAWLDCKTTRKNRLESGGQLRLGATSKRSPQEEPDRMCLRFHASSKRFRRILLVRSPIEGDARVFARYLRRPPFSDSRRPLRPVAGHEKQAGEEDRHPA